MEITLVHTTFRPESKLVSFYDGHLVAYDGVLTISLEGERGLRWAKQAWYNGYQDLPDGTHLSSVSELESVVEEMKNDWSAESADTTSFDSGRQPAVEHRLRSGKSSGSRPVQGTRLGGSNGSGAYQGTA